MRKPITPLIFLARVNNQIKANTKIKELQEYIVKLENDNNRFQTDYNKFTDVVLLAVSYLTKFNHANAFEHSSLIKEYIKILVNQLTKNKEYIYDLTSEFVEHICLSATLYDIGMVGIRDNTLLKRDKYTENENHIMQEHTRLGCVALEFVKDELLMKPEVTTYIDTAIEMAHYHHEKWDGTGYPEGLSGFEIPISARLIHIIDTLEALISKRPYREKVSFDEAKEIIIAGAGTQFDPTIVEAFEKCFEEIKKVGLQEISQVNQNNT
jgi:putative two-component system response regulator